MVIVTKFWRRLFRQFTPYDKEVGAWVYATGSTQARTRLYRIGITKYFDEVKQDFEIYGLKDGEWEYFEKGVEYTAFVVRRKQANGV